MTTAAEIDSFLVRNHLMSMNPVERRITAERLADYGLSVGQLVRVWNECKASAREGAPGLMVKTLREPSQVAEIVDDLEKTNAEREKGQGDPSSLNHVTEANPYGWASPERMVAQDHGIPGAWNGYRQDCNLTTEEARDLGLLDFRRHGCGRYEVLERTPVEDIRKSKPIHHSTPQWDPMVLALARGLAEGPDAPERKMYGE